jgi:hypothetical protein
VRRLLIPGLLVGLLVVVVLAALLGRAEGTVLIGAGPGGADDVGSAEATRVSSIDDMRITESSGLAVSRKHDDLAYTINDSGNAPIVFAIRISSGDVVGTTTIRNASFTLLDTEAMALRDGTLWVADTGDNIQNRTDAALYAFDEPGPGEHTVTPKRYPVTYEDGPQNVEAIAVPPDAGRILLMSKLAAGGIVHRLPKNLREDAANTATATSRATPAFTSDATYTDDGRHVLVRNYPVAQVRDAKTWDLVRADVLPSQQLGETIAVEPSGRSYLVGSEGVGSELWRVAFDPDAPAATPTPSRTEQPVVDGEPQDELSFPRGLIVAVGVVVALVIGIMVVRRRSRPS